MKKSAIKSKKLTLHECKRELFLFAQSIKNIADRLEQDAITYQQYSLHFVQKEIIPSCTHVK